MFWITMVVVIMMFCCTDNTFFSECYLRDRRLGAQNKFTKLWLGNSWSVGVFMANKRIEFHIFWKAVAKIAMKRFRSFLFLFFAWKKCFFLNISAKQILMLWGEYQSFCNLNVACGNLQPKCSLHIGWASILDWMALF